jgi:hypothetical protein
MLKYCEFFLCDPENYVPGGKEPIIFVSDWAESIDLIFNVIQLFSEQFTTDL